MCQGLAGHPQRSPSPWTWSFCGAGALSPSAVGKLAPGWAARVAQSWLTLCDPMDYTVRGILQARLLEWVAVPFSRDLPNPGIEPRSPALQADSLPTEPPGKPKNTGAGSLSLLQWIFPTQRSNPGLLHGRQIPYRLSRQGSPGRGSARV